MEIGLIIIVIFAALVGILIFRFDNPTSQREKITGRGGDFHE